MADRYGPEHYKLAREVEYKALVGLGELATQESWDRYRDNVRRTNEYFASLDLYTQQYYPPIIKGM